MSARKASRNRYGQPIGGVGARQGAAVTISERRGTITVDINEMGAKRPVSVKVEYSVVVERPVADVWAFMDNLDNYPEWIPGLAEIRQITEGRKSVGTRMVWVYTFLGRSLAITSEVTEFEPNQTFGGTMSSGPLQISSRFRYVPLTPHQTRIAIVLEGDTGGLFKLADPLVGRALYRQIEAAYGNLKDVLEARVLA